MGEPAQIDQDLEEHRLIVDPVGVTSEVLNNISDPREAIRELLSNAAAKEVQASHVVLQIFESEKGLSFDVQDDGVGMGYTQDPNNPGRLDKFLNIAQGRQSGLQSDEFGAKGFGTILLYNAREVELKTWDGGPKSYRVILHEPRQSILENKQLVKPLVYSVKFDPLVKRGTAVMVKGWGDQLGITKYFRLDELERYLRFYTVVGYTRLNMRERPLPEVTVSVGGAMKTIKPGFPYITTDDISEDAKTVVFGPVEVVKKTPKGKQVKVVLKGGITLETKKYGLTESTGGVWLSVNGIPYFRLLTNKYARKLYMSDDFVRFVAECDDIRLNLSRSAVASGDDKEAFEDALQDAFNKIKEERKFQRFYHTWERELHVKAQERMAQKKQEFLMPEQRFVWSKGRPLIAEPESEKDVAALLWILEGMNGLPFHHFRTLQYPGYYRDIDLLIEIQEDEESERQLCVYAELEKNFSNIIKHGHAVNQMTCALCWKVDKSKISMGSIQQTKKQWKYSYTVSDKHIVVYEISSFPDLFIGTRQDANEHFGSIIQKSGER